jgi:hypothetical protein
MARAKKAARGKPSGAQKRQLEKAQRHHTRPVRGPKKGASGHGVMRTERGEDQPRDKKRART